MKSPISAWNNSSNTKKRNILKWFFFSILSINAGFGIWMGVSFNGGKFLIFLVLCNILEQVKDLYMRYAQLSLDDERKAREILEC